METVLHLQLKTLCPIHVGSGDDFMPGTYTMDLSEEVLYAAEMSQLMPLMPDEDKNTVKSRTALGTIDLKGVIKIFCNNDIKFGVPVRISKGVAAEMRSVLNAGGASPSDMKGLGRFYIPRVAWIKGDGRPYIPGTSIKGALRTAYLNYIGNKKKDKIAYLEKKKEEKVEDVLLNRYKEGDVNQTASDPFRLVQVSDFLPVGDIKRTILFEKNLKKGDKEHSRGGASNLTVPIEAIDEGNLFHGTIKIRDEEMGVIQEKITPDNLIESLKFFFIKEYNREREEIDGANLNIPGISDFNSSQFPVRIGKHSGAECVTIDGLRSIKIKTGGRGGRTEEKATTFWFAAEESGSLSNLKPFGWAKLEEISDEDGHYIKDIESKYIREVANHRSKYLEVYRKQRQGEEERREREMERAKREREEERRKAEAQAKLESMSEEERLLYSVEHGEGDRQNKASELFMKLDSYDSDLKVKAAQVLKNFYVEVDKWDRASLSKKQKNKVKKLKAVLGE